MTEMAAFLVFTVTFALVYYLHFSQAHRTLWMLRGIESTELDMNYVRVEDYFGQSFRGKLSEWLRLPDSPGSTGRMRVIERGPERIFVAGGAQYPDGRSEDVVLVIEGSFSCGAGCEFQRELYVRDDCEIGPGSRLQAIAVDGSLTLGRGVEVRRWVDSKGFLDLHEDCTVESRVTSRTAVRLGAGVRVLSAFAPEVVTEGRRETMVRGELRHSRLVTIPHAAEAAGVPAAGYDPRRLYHMGGNTYVYDGDLHVAAPVRLLAPLVVRGSFSCGEESLLAADIKAEGSIEVGAFSVARGNLVAGGGLTVGEHCFVQALLHAQGRMRLRQGTRGLRDKLPVAAFASGPLIVESNVVFNGKLASASYVEAVSSPVAWLADTALFGAMEA